MSLIYQITDYLCQLGFDFCSLDDWFFIPLPSVCKDLYQWVCFLEKNSELYLNFKSNQPVCTSLLVNRGHLHLMLLVRDIYSIPLFCHFFLFNLCLFFTFSPIHINFTPIHIRGLVIYWIEHEGFPLAFFHSTTHTIFLSYGFSVYIISLNAFCNARLVVTNYLSLCLSWYFLISSAVLDDWNLGWSLLTFRTWNSLFSSFFTHKGSDVFLIFMPL